MVEAGRVLGSLAAVMLLMAVIAWVKIIRAPRLQRTDGTTDIDQPRVEVASKLLLWAAGLSSAAALFAVAGWIFK